MLPGCIPWPPESARAYRSKGYWEDMTIPAMLGKLAADAPDRIAVTEGERAYTLSDLTAGSIRLAAHFHRLGLVRGDRAVFQLPNSGAFFQVFLALQRIGVIPIMALPPHRETELLHFARFGGAKALFIPQKIGEFDFRPMAEAVRGGVPSLQHVLVLGDAMPGQISLTGLTGETPSGADLDAVSAMQIEADEVALMLLSGGTTALPKLIPRTHNDYVYNFKQSARIGGFDDKTVLLAVLPLAHNYTLGSPGALGALAYGGRVVIAPRTDCETVFSLVERERVTVIPAAVPLIVNWLNDPRLERFGTSSLRVVQNGGARLSPELRSPAPHAAWLPVPGGLWHRRGPSQHDAP